MTPRFLRIICISILFLSLFKIGICSPDTIYVVREIQLNKIELKISNFEKTISDQAIKNVEFKAQLDLNKELIDGKDKEIDRLFNLIIALFGMVTVLIGITIWDRKTADKPVKKQLNSLKNEIEKMRGDNQKLKNKLDSTDIPV